MDSPTNGHSRMDPHAGAPPSPFQGIMQSAASQAVMAVMKGLKHKTALQIALGGGAVIAALGLALGCAAMLAAPRPTRQPKKRSRGAKKLPSRKQGKQARSTGSTKTPSSAPAEQREQGGTSGSTGRSQA